MVTNSFLTHSELINAPPLCPFAPLSDVPRVIKVMLRAKFARVDHECEHGPNALACITVALLKRMEHYPRDAWNSKAQRYIIGCVLHARITNNIAQRKPFWQKPLARQQIQHPPAMKSSRMRPATRARS